MLCTLFIFVKRAFIALPNLSCFIKIIKTLNNPNFKKESLIKRNRFNQLGFYQGNILSRNFQFVKRAKISLLM